MNVHNALVARLSAENVIFIFARDEKKRLNSFWHAEKYSVFKNIHSESSLNT